MQVSVETTSPIERQMTVTVPAARIEDDVQSRLKKAASTARVDGFRPGKVPVKVIKRRYGQGIRQEVLGEVIQNTFYEAVTQEKLRPAGGPQIEPKSDAEGEDFEYLATFEVYPEIELADFSEVSIDKESASIADSDVEQMVENLRKQHADWKEVERAAQSGDRVNIDFEGFKGGEPFEGGSSEGHDLVLGSNTMIPGFEAGLEGVSAGDETRLELTFPESYHAEELAGAEVVFNVRVNRVSEPELPALDADFFARFGIEEADIEGFNAEIRKNMERELRQALNAKHKNRVLNKLVEINAVEVPKALVDGEIDRLRQQAVQQFGGGNQLDPSSLPAELFAQQAQQRVATGLLVGEIIQAEELKPDPERVRQTVEDIADTYQEPQQVRDYYLNNKEQLAQVEALVLEDQVVDLLMSRAQVKEREVSYEEALKQDEPAAEEENEEQAETSI